MVGRDGLKPQFCAKKESERRRLGGVLGENG